MRKLAELDQAMEHLESRLQVCKNRAFDAGPHDDDDAGEDLKTTTKKVEMINANSKVTSMKEFVNVVVLSDHGQSKLPKQV